MQECDYAPKIYKGVLKLKEELSFLYTCLSLCTFLSVRWLGVELNHRVAHFCSGKNMRPSKLLQKEEKLNRKIIVGRLHGDVSDVGVYKKSRKIIPLNLQVYHLINIFRNAEECLTILCS